MPIVEKAAIAPTAEMSFLLIIFFGVYFYQMLFEARARYLFVFLPVLLIMVMQGYCNLSTIAGTILSKRKKDKDE